MSPGRHGFYAFIISNFFEDSDNLRIFASPVNAAADCTGASFYLITATKLNVFFVAKR